MRFRLKTHQFFGHGMEKFQAAGAEGQTRYTKTGRVVFAVAEKRTACMGKLDADLMMASRVQMDFKKREGHTFLFFFGKNTVMERGFFGPGRGRSAHARQVRLSVFDEIVAKFSLIHWRKSLDDSLVVFSEMVFLKLAA